jgi:glycerol-3-phosphate dehydrogenase subunit C
MQEKNISKFNFEQCQKCSVCNTVCPMLAVNENYPGPKQAGPDGERYRLKNPEFYDYALKYCLNCKRCEVACPSGVRIADIIASAKLDYGRKSRPLRDWTLANTDLVGTMASAFAPVANPVLGLKPVKAAMHGLIGVDKHRQFPAYSGQKFETWFRRKAESSQAGYSRFVSFFHGCYANYNYPQLGKDFVAVMNACGYGVRLLEKEKCCGVAMMSGGMFDTARKHARINLAAIGRASAEGRITLTTSSTCTLTMREEYPGVLGIDNEAVREDILLAVRFIYEAVEKGDVQLAFKPGFKARAAYHVPCHMEKLGWSLFTRALMERIPGMELVPLDSNCCGIAGTYGFKKENYERSQQIGQALFDQIGEVKPDYVICECETCKWQIEMSTGVEVRNPISVLAEALDLEATAALNR